MKYRGYSLKQKIKFFDLYKQGGSIAAAARAMGFSTDICKYWLKNQDKIRADYELSLLPVDLKAMQEYEPPKRFPLEEKIRCIKAIEAGLPFHQASIEFDCAMATVQSWYKAKDGLLVLYYSQQDVGETVECPEEGHHSSDIAWEAQMANEQLDKELAKKCKAHAKEIEYLKDKVSFLENLNGILKERTRPVKKRSFCSNRAKPQGRETERKTSLCHCRGIPMRLLQVSEPGFPKAD